MLLINRSRLRRAFKKYPRFIHIDFNDFRSSFSQKTRSELIRSLVVYSICSSTALVKNANKLLALSRSLVGSYATTYLLKVSFFKQFCAGETPLDIKPTVKKLELSGIGSILDYCAEADIEVKKPSGDILSMRFQYS